MVSSFLLGFLLALGASVSFAANRSFGSKSLLSFPSAPEAATYVTLLTGVVASAAAMIVSGQALQMLGISLPALAIFATVGVIHFSVGRKLSYTGVKNLGANQVSALLSTQALYSLFFAVTFLSEAITWVLGIGAALILAAIFLLEARASASRRGGNFKLGFASGLLAGLIFGISPILVKVGLGLFPNFTAATFVSYVAGLVYYTLSLRPGRVSMELKQTHRDVLIPFIVMGIFGASSQLFRFAALSFTTVVVVAPILSTNPVFTILFTKVQAKNYEIFGFRTMLSILMVVIGTILVSLYSGS